jgi:transposase-like protein
MAINRIQFQKGLSFNEFEDKCGTQEQCEEIVFKAKWPKGYICPSCGNKEHCIVWHGKIKTFQCNHCHNQTTLTAGTIFHSSKLPLKTWFLGMYFMTQSKNSIAALELKRLLGISYRSAWRFKHKLIQVMREREEKRVLTGQIEIDDAYLGGERSGGKAGRGSENKIPFLAAVQKDDSGKPMLAVFTKVKAFKKKEIESWGKKFLAAGSVVVSDGYKCFGALANEGVEHRPQTVGAGKKSTSMPCFAWVNTLLGNLKNSITGTYHSIKFDKYAQRYLSEIQYRFNRRYDLKSILTRFAYACAGTGARPEWWLRLAED